MPDTCGFGGNGGRPQRYLLVALVLVASPLPARAADPFEALNESLREQHAGARAREWARSGPVILVEFDKLTLIRGADRKAAEVVPPRYHRLKSIAHAPLAIYLAVQQPDDKPLDAEQRQQLVTIATRIDAVRAALGGAEFEPEVLKRQQEILSRSADFLANALRTGSASAAEVAAFVAGVRPLVMKNVAESADLQIRAYDAQVARWKQSLPPAEWERLRVVITGSALPRKQNLATQYFARVLGVPGECPRLVYAESLYDEAKALKLLNATAVDARAGQVFFDDPTYLHRDLMADVAATFLRDHAAELKALAAPDRR